MNYPPNTFKWPKGAAVIHDADAKQEYMLMRVLGYTKDGLCRTKYIAPPEWMDRRHAREIYENDIQYLHDPARFNISTRRAHQVSDAELERRAEKLK